MEISSQILEKNVELNNNEKFHIKMLNAAKEIEHKLSMKLKSFKTVNEPKESWGKEIKK